MKHNSIDLLNIETVVFHTLGFKAGDHGNIIQEGSCKKFHAKILIARHFMIIIFCLKIVLDGNSLLYKYNRLSDARLMKNIKNNCKE